MKIKLLALQCVSTLIIASCSTPAKYEGPFFEIPFAYNPYRPNPLSPENKFIYKIDDLFENDSVIRERRYWERVNSWRHHEARYIKKCVKWLRSFYTDLYTCGGNLQDLSAKYAANIDSVLRTTLAAAYERDNPQGEGLDWALFGFNVKDSTELRALEISYDQNRWFNVRLLKKDTLILRVRIEDYKPKILINGLLNPTHNTIMTPFIRMKIRALVKLYHELDSCNYDDFTKRYEKTFSLNVLDSLQAAGKNVYNWDKLKLGKEKFAAIRDEDVSYLGDDWFLIAPMRRKVGLVVIQLKEIGPNFKVTEIKVPE